MSETKRASGAGKDVPTAPPPAAQIVDTAPSPDALALAVVDSLQWRGAARSDGEACRAELATGSTLYALAVAVTTAPSSTMSHPLALALRGVL